jgi:nucleoid DNA-binding protein
MPVNNDERVGLSIFNRKTGKVYILIPDCGGIALHGGTSFRKDLNCMQASLEGRQELATRVQQALALTTKKEAEMVVDAVVVALEATLLNNLGADGFTLKLGSFGKFSVRHKPGILRRIPFTGKTILTKDQPYHLIEERATNICTLHSEGLIFRSRRGTPLLETNVPHDGLHPALRALGLPKGVCTHPVAAVTRGGNCLV